LHSFTPPALDVNVYTNKDGARPQARLLLSGNSLYGTATVGGAGGSGTVFLLIWPELAIVQSGTNIILTWSTNATGFSLQSATNLVSPAAWSSVSPLPVVVNSRFTVTNRISDTQQFYRLIQ